MLSSKSNDMSSKQHIINERLVSLCERPRPPDYVRSHPCGHPTTAETVVSDITTPQALTTGHPKSLETVVSDITTPPALTTGQPKSSSRRSSKGKLLDVSITVLSIAGLHVKDEASVVEEERERQKPKTDKKKTTKKKRVLALPSKILGGVDDDDGKGDNKEKDDNVTEMTEADVSTFEEASVGSGGGGNIVKPTPSTPTTIVASFSRTAKAWDGRMRTSMTHISSLPLSPTTTTTTTTTTGRKGGKKAAASSNNRVVRWPGRGWDVDDDAVGEEDAVVAAAAAASSVSSYRFRLTFRPEEEEVPPDDPTSSSSIRYAPKPLPIQISVSRGGRLFKLGTATVLLSGEEDGRTSVNVPIASCNHPSSGVNRFRDMLRGKVRMMRLSGDTLSCGMDPNATLRVLVRTTDPESVGGGGMTTVEEAGGPGGFRVTIVPKPIPTSSVIRECRPPSSVTSAVDRQECDRPIPLTATAPSPMRVMDRWEKVEVCADDSRSFSSSSSSSSSSSYSSSSTSSSSLSSSTTTTTSSSSSSFCEGEEATHKEDISCSSSAYMSVHKARSSSTATTLVSDMTDCNSRKSLEVEATRPPTDRGSDDDAPTAASTRGGAATWRQRFTCGLPACLYNDPGDALMDVLEDHRNLVVERCDKIRFTPKASYSTDGGESFIISSRSGSSQSGSEL